MVLYTYMLAEELINQICKAVDDSKEVRIELCSMLINVSNLYISINDINSDYVDVQFDGIRDTIKRSNLKSHLKEMSGDYYTFNVLMQVLKHDSSLYCSHDYVDVGFRFTKMACKYCGKGQ